MTDILTAPQAVILAAGRGSRLDGHIVPKPLHTLLGTTLLERNIRTLAKAGIEEVIVVVGFKAEEIRGAVHAMENLPIPVHFIDNPEWDLSNGVSVLAARPLVKGPFLLTMADHVLTTGMVSAMARNTPPPGGTILAVDRAIDDIFDMDDATKVLSDGADGLMAIGKTIPEFDCIDTGLFLGTEGLFAALQSVYDRRGDTSLSDGIQTLGEADKMRLYTIEEGQWWQDVDTPEAAEEALRRLQSRSTP